MSTRNLEERLALHRAFWERKGQARPVASFRVGDFFFARHFRGGLPLLQPGRIIQPHDVDAASFAADYERLYAESEAIGQDGFYTAEPYTGLPWMEAMLGCQVRAGAESFTSVPYLRSAAAGEGLAIGPDNPWLRKYLELTVALVKQADGRFTVGQPIMRGPTDMVGALLGQTEMVYALADEPRALARLAMTVTDAFLGVLEAQRALVPPFHGGSALGFYHVWTPGRSGWFQDDLSALLSPRAYRDVFLPCAQAICSRLQNTAVHLHSSSFFVLDDLLAIDRLLAVEVNADVGGPDVAAMMPTLARIMERKRLILWGDLTPADLALVRRRLPVDGLALFIAAPTMEQAIERNLIVQEWQRACRGLSSSR
jgi:hypothetical protein